MSVSTFNTRSRAFFDELKAILQQRRRRLDESGDRRDRDTVGPYSNLLTQDETPGDWYRNVPPDPTQPEVIVRGTMG